MTNNAIFTFLYIFLLVLFVLIYVNKKLKKQAASIETKEENEEAGLTEPASLHPYIHIEKCIGSGACARACPEGNVIGVIKGKATLINATKCIGHGACKAACPIDAISLVFGTEKRGMEIPVVKPDFETNVPGLYIAGELGGMGLIRNSTEQGKQALESIAKRPDVGKGNDLDVLIIGSGPAGFAATLGAKEHKLRSVTIEQDSLGGTVFQFPRGKVVMTQPAELPIVGKVKVNETSKEALLELWQGIEKETGIVINYHERMETITPIESGGFTVKTTKSSYNTNAVLLAIGRRGTPRKLGVPGEEQSKVVYRMIDPAQYQGQHVLIVGGGDSALEAATSIADEPGTTVTLSYRSESFGRAKAKNRQKVQDASDSGNLTLMMKSNVKEIGEKNVIIAHEDQLKDIPNDGIIICAGGILPTPFLKEIGIMVETKHGTV